MSSSFDDLCFVIAPIGTDGTDVRKRSDSVLKHIIKPAAEACCLRTERANDLKRPGIITSDIIDRILYARIVVADLTGRNANVFYELGMRHLAGLPALPIQEKGEDLPFDVQDIRTIFYTLSDPDEVEQAREELRLHIEAALADPDSVSNPVAAKVELKALQRSGNAMERAAAGILEEIQNLKTLVSLPARLPSQAIQALQRVQKDLEMASAMLPTAEEPTLNAESLEMLQLIIRATVLRVWALLNVSPWRKGGLTGGSGGYMSLGEAALLASKSSGTPWQDAAIQYPPEDID